MVHYNVVYYYYSNNWGGNGCTFFFLKVTVNSFQHGFIYMKLCAGWHLKGWHSTSFKKLICIEGNTVNLHNHIILLFALITFPHSHNPLCMRLIQALYEINTWQIHFNSSIRSHCKNHLLLKILDQSINRRKTITGTGNSHEI